MVEMGDQREGIMPQDLDDIALQVVDMPGVALKGIGANFACLSGVAPNAANMETLSALANNVERQSGPVLQTVSGGNSANLPWALGRTFSTGRINDLQDRRGNPFGQLIQISGDQIGGMFRDAFTLVAEIIETDVKSVRPYTSALLKPNFGETVHLMPNPWRN